MNAILSYIGVGAYIGLVAMAVWLVYDLRKDARKLKKLDK